jgi:hypothetical protein
VKTVPKMNVIGVFKSVPSTIPTSEHVYKRLSAYKLSHVYLMRQLAYLSNTPIPALTGDGVIHHFRRRYQGTLILNVDIDRKHGAELLREGFGDLVAFGRDYIANPDLVERIRLDAPRNEQRPEGCYGSSSVGYGLPLQTTNSGNGWQHRHGANACLRSRVSAHSSSTERDTPPRGAILIVSVVNWMSTEKRPSRERWIAGEKPT